MSGINPSNLPNFLGFPGDFSYGLPEAMARDKPVLAENQIEIFLIDDEQTFTQTISVFESTTVTAFPPLQVGDRISLQSRQADMASVGFRFYVVVDIQMSFVVEVQASSFGTLTQEGMSPRQIMMIFVKSDYENAPTLNFQQSSPD